VAVRGIPVSMDRKLVERRMIMKRLLEAVPIGNGERNSATLLVAQLFILIHLAGCSGIPISYYDATTYTQLTSLKAETTSLVESFDTKPFKDNEARIEATTLNLQRAYEYEKGKGDPNSDTAKQFDKIYGLFADDVKDYRESGPGTLGPKYFQEAARVLGQAFDIAISTENLKNKDKR
jgi:hypothetical protein